MAPYVPKHKRQLTGSELGPYNCNMAAAAMLADAMTLGLVDVTADAMRSASGDSAGGTDIRDAATALARYNLYPTLYDSTDALGWTGLRSAIAHDRPAVVHGDYDAIPAILKGDKAFYGLHSVYWNAIVAGGVMVGDPLNDGRRGDIPKGYVVWPESVANGYAAAFPGGPYTALIATLTRIRVRVDVANVRSGPARSAAIITHKRRGALLRAGIRAELGERIGGDARWYRVWLADRNRLGYMHASVVTVSTIT